MSGEIRVFIEEACPINPSEVGVFLPCFWAVKPVNCEVYNCTSSWAAAHRQGVVSCKHKGLREPNENSRPGEKDDGKGETAIRQEKSN